MKRRTSSSGLKEFDWEAGAGVAAGLAALLLHTLYIINQDVVLAGILLVLGLLLIRDLRREAPDGDAGGPLKRLSDAVDQARHGRDAHRCGADWATPVPGASEAFARHATGDMIWFNVCLLQQ